MEDNFRKQLENDVFISTSIFNGMWRVHIRRWYGKKQDWKPSPSAFTLNDFSRAQLKRHADNIIRDIVEMNAVYDMSAEFDRPIGEDFDNKNKVKYRKIKVKKKSVC